MIHSGSLRFQVTLQRRVEAQNAAGEVETGYIDVLDVLAAIEPLSGRELFAAQQVQAEVTTRIRIRYRRGVDATYRVTHVSEHDSPVQTDYYDVQSVIPDASTGRRELVLLCIKREADGWRTLGSSTPLVPGPVPAPPGFSVDWSQITNIPLTFPPSAHFHAASDITSGTFADALIAQSNITQHEAALVIDWTQLTNVPVSSPVDWTDVLNKPTTFPSDWATLANIPATFTPSAHVHAAGDVTSGTFGDARIAASNVTQHQAALSIAWGQLTSVPATFTPSAHVHAAGDVTSGTFGDARIAASNVTQHQAALSIAWGQVTGVPAFDHGALTGLGDDDHSQYILVAGTRAFTGTQQTLRLEPVADITHNLGSTSLRYDVVNARQLRLLAGAGTITQINGAHLVGRAVQTSTGLAQLAADSANANSIAILAAAAVTNGAGNARAEASGRGAFCTGEAQVNGAGAATLRASNSGALAAGIAQAFILASTISASGTGSFAQGLANNEFGGTADILATFPGCFAQGSVTTFGTSAIIEASNNGSFAQGNALVGGIIRASGAGSFAQGLALGAGITASGGGAMATGQTGFGFSITASGAGSFARGLSTSFAITASGQGAVAMGWANSGTIVASNDNSFQFGPGTNAIADTLRVGDAGLHLKGTVGAFTAPANGQMYLGGAGNAFVLIRSGGQAVQLGPVNSWTTGAHATLRNFTGTTTAAEALQLLETLVEDLRAANII